MANSVSELPATSQKGASICRGIAYFRTIRNDRSWHYRACGADHEGMDLKDTMARNVRRLRHERDLTQEDLAALAGLSNRYIGAIERATVSASVTVLGRIAEALSVDPAVLVSR